MGDGLVGIAILPTPPLQVRALSPRQPADLIAPVADLRAASRAALEALPPSEVDVLLVPGPLAGVVVHGPASRTSLRGSGVADVDVDVPIDRAAVAALTATGLLDVANGSADVLGTAASVLSVLALDVGRGPFVVVTCPVAADALDLGVLGGLLSVALADHTWTLIAAGDLATTLTDRSAGYLVEDADAEEEAFVAALRTSDVAAYEAWRVTAQRVGASGWSAIVVAAQLAARMGAALEVVAHTGVRGIGGLVATARRP